MKYIKRWSQRIIYDSKYESPALMALFNNLDIELNHAKKYFKNDKTSTVCLSDLNGESIIIKRSNAKNSFHFLRRSLCESRAFKSWRNAQYLIEAGISTFEPIAVIENRWGPFKGCSYLITSYLMGESAAKIFAYGAKPSVAWPILAHNIIAMIEKLSRAWVSHRDLNLSNIIINKEQPFLIDLDGMRHHRWRLLAKFYADRDLRRFMKNWDELPGILPETPVLFQNILNFKLN